jgi:hypothetical protein
MNKIETNLTELRISLVSSKKDLDFFIKLPESIFADDPCWVTPLMLERRMFFSDKHNPYFQHAKWQAWLAWRGDQIVGRISAQVDSLHLERYNDATGFFGFLDAEDNQNTFDALISTAEKWLKDQKIRKVRGPFNLSINEEMGLLVEGFDTPPVFMMGHAKPYYQQRIENYGYVKVVDTFAYMIAPDFKVPRVMTRLLSKNQDRINVRPINKKKYNEEIAIMREIFNDAWSENWGFLPFTVAEFDELGKNLKFLIDSEFIQIAEVDNEPAAFIVTVPNLNEVIKDLNGKLFPTGLIKLLWRLKVKYPKSARVPLLGVKKKWQNTRLGPLLTFLMVDVERQQMVARGVTDIELSWILEDNTGMRGIIRSIGGREYKRYRIYEKNISD